MQIIRFRFIVTLSLLDRIKETIPWLGVLVMVFTLHSFGELCNVNRLMQHKQDVCSAALSERNHFAEEWCHPGHVLLHCIKFSTLILQQKR